MIAHRVKSPQLVLQPEHRIDQRPVMVFSSQLAGEEPNLPQTRYVPHRIDLDVQIVVPDEATPQHRRQIGDDHQQAERDKG